MSKEFEKHLLESFLEYLDESGDNSIDDLESFDLHAQDVNDWLWLQQFIPGIIVSSGGGVLPFQAEGLIQGYPFYYREEWGRADLRISDQAAEFNTGENSIYDPTRALWVGSFDFPETEKENPNWISHLMNCIEDLHKSEYRYTFKCHELKYSDSHNHSTVYRTDEDSSIAGWGHSAKEAFKNAYNYWVNENWYLKEHGWTQKQLQHEWDLRNPDLTPINEDSRVYPEATPDFKVTVPEVWRDDDNKIKIPEELFEKKNES